MIQKNPKKYIVLLVAGQKPTVPSPANIFPVDLNWKSTDILIGQYAYNVPDKKWYTRDSSGIVESEDSRFKDVGDSLSDIYDYINGLSGGLPSYFELVNEGLPTEYLRLKKPLAVDYEIQAWSNTGWLPPNIWESMPIASSSSYGAIKYNPEHFELNGSNQLTLLDGVISPAEHTHSWNDITSGVPLEFNPSAHGLISDRHTVSGLTTGHFLRATSATAFGFGALTTQDVTSVLSGWFELVGDAPNQYIRCKYPFASDYEISSWTNTGWLPPNIWEAMPIASEAVLGGVKIGTGIFKAEDGTISVTTGAGMVYPAAGIPVSTGSAWGTSITDNSANWNTAYGWGNWASNFGTIAGKIAQGNDSRINNGQTAYGWGNHASPGYFVGTSSTIRQLISSSATGLTYTNTTGIFSLTSGYAIPTTTQVSNWNAAYGWGNHATLNYHTGSGSSGYLAKFTGAYTQSSSIIYDNGTNIGIGRTPSTYKCEIAGDLFATGGWIRTDGARGWYNETYGGGIYMEDSTWVRVYNNKKFFVNNDLLAVGNIASQGGYFEIANSIGTTKWTIRLNASTDEIDFYNASGVKKMWLDQNGNLYTKGNITAYA